MSSRPSNMRLRRVTWDPVPRTWSVRRRVRLLILLGVPCAVWFFGWLLNPDRVGTQVLYGILVTAELFNLTQALGFWWTVSHERVREKYAPTVPSAVDVFIPVYEEPLDIVDLRGRRRHRPARRGGAEVHVLDGTGDDERHA